LAGPNETIQILLNHLDWILIAKVIWDIYGKDLVKDATKAAWKAAAPRLAQASEGVKETFGHLVSGIKEAIHAKAPVILGFPRTPVRARRHVGIEIIDTSPEEIARIITLLANYGEEIERLLDEWDKMHSHNQTISYVENSDCSVKLTVSDDGVIQLRATIFDNSFANREEVIYQVHGLPPKED
jgi:hypothetical protein